MTIMVVMVINVGAIKINGVMIDMVHLLDENPAYKDISWIKYILCTPSGPKYLQHFFDIG